MLLLIVNILNNNSTAMNKKDEFEKSRELGLKQVEIATDLRSRFFFHWSILSGATITLIIPLLLELKKRELLNESINIKITIILLATSLILSSLRNYIAAGNLWKSGLANLEKSAGNNQGYNDLLNKRFKMIPLQKTVEPLALLSYIASLIFLYIFICSSIF